MPTKVLVLHGYAQNGTIFSKRIGALRKECGKNVEFVFAEAPHILKPVDFVWNQEKAEDAGVQAEPAPANNTEQDPTLTPRAWWKPNPERTRAVGIQEGIFVIEGGCLRIQGAAFAAVLSALLEKPHTHPEFLVDGEPVASSLFCLAVAGFKLLDSWCDSLWEGGYDTPTVHVIGQTDVVVAETRTRSLGEVANNIRLEEHPGGHFVPSKGPWRKFLAAYLKDPAGQHTSPGSADAGTSPSISAVNSVAGSRSETPTVP
ncbi:hypothetical protein FA13DRAFT_1785943 [Coprinellus micaceus]|uniref:Serine hydrolase domain-containing protein n=1 Tax=Coprinellus micaceus TaxID=71717 RepID=A0A4Y7TVV4_COPMI|nr:hypothetical protein FA13DRAFT_1785943 [Coprinellus micaceus]